MGVGGQRPPQERDQIPIVQEAGWASGSVWMGAENFAVTGICTASSESLYRLCCPSSMLLGGSKQMMQG